MTGATPVWDPPFIETLEGSFSSVSTPLIARVGALFSVFRDIQDLHSLHSSKPRNSVEFVDFFGEVANFYDFCDFVVFRPDFGEILSEFHEKFRFKSHI